MSRLHERIDALSPVQRVIAILASITLAVFVLGFWVGFGGVAIKQGHLPSKPIAYLAVGLALMISVGVVQLLRALVRGGIFAGMTSFDQRYWRMMLAIGVIGGLIGMALVTLGLIGTSMSLADLMSGNFTLEPAAAITVTALLGVLLAIAFRLYHRAIDDHEERAYLWGSQVAYYFTILAIPGWWLLSRGGLLAPLDFTAAIAIVLASFVVQAAVWGWFKFR